MTRPVPLKLGPFVGGMNTASDPSAVAENELVDCINFELDLDGSLVCRPPIVETVNNSGTWTERIVIIGRAIFAGGTYVIGSNVNGTYAFDGAAWTTIKTGLQARVALQYQDFLYIVAQTGSAENGGYWDGAAFTTDASMPKGEAAVFHKSRMWIVPGISATGANAHQLRFTDPISVVAPNPFVWTGTNLIPVSQGDGQKLIDIVQFNDNLMLFKQDSTYVFAYDLSVSDAILRKVNNDLGTTTRRCMVTWENSVFIYHEGTIYEIQNYDFKQINTKVPFFFDQSAPSTRAEEVFICLLGDRLLVRYYNRVYAYNLITKTWSRWLSANPLLHNFGPLVELPALPTVNEVPQYYAGSSVLSAENVFVIGDGYDTTIEETLADEIEIQCTAVSKNFDFDDPMHFKKLKWWGIDVLSVGNIVGIATPVVLNFRVTWNQLHTFTWNQLHSFTWNQPLAVISAIETDVSDTTSLLRKFLKFKKALRFRQINFKVILESDGSTATGPCRLFTMTAIVGGKETVVKQVS